MTPCAPTVASRARAGLPGENVVFVGDGVSDHCAALAADRVFARDALAQVPRLRGLAFERFSDLNGIVAAALRLTGGGAVVPPGRRRGRKT